jgi:lysophospholipase L1-like esterase
MKKKLLIVGDSFAADWTVKYKGEGWVNTLCKDYDVTNIAQAGVSEYKIYNQLKKTDVSKYDIILISHTSAYRIPVVEHPIHSKDILHNNCDLIYTDLKEYDNELTKIAVDFYEKLFDPDYFIFIHNLIVNEIIKRYPNAINITFFDSFSHPTFHNFEEIFLKNKGNMNHLNEDGNNLIYKKIKNILEIE